MSLKLQIIIYTLVSIIAVLLFYMRFEEYITLESFNTNRELVEALYKDYTIYVLLALFLMFFVSSAAPIPIAGTLSIICGALMGFTSGVIFVSFSTAIGATLTFLSTRYLFEKTAKKRYEDRLNILLEKIEPENVLHAISIRLVPFLPFFAINTAMALSRITVSRFYVTTQLGMLFFIFLLVNAGSQLDQVEQLEQLEQLFTPTIIASAVMLAIAPITIRYVIKKSNRSL